MASFNLGNNEKSGQLRGLSGGSVRWVHLDDANSFYNFRLREHYTDDDLATNPQRVWQASDHADAEGLRAHVADALTDGQQFTDVLVILSNDDYENAFSEDPDFVATLTDVLREEVDAFLSKTTIGQLARPLGVRVVRDGSDEVGGMDRSLLEGQFITGLMPNLYGAPGVDSRPIIGLHVNVPGAWEGYREVGCLYDDQLLFTVGNHWLDNFSHPGLKDAAVYLLRRDEDGAFFHIVNPDLQDRYQITSTDQGGTSVITLATRDGVPLAYMVLAVLEVEADPADMLFADEPAEAPAPAVELRDEPSLDVSWEPSPMDGGPMLQVDAVDAPPLEPLAVPMASSPRSRNSKTIIPEANNERIFTLQERGALLQKVHFSAFMLGYDVYLGLRGELGTVVDQPAATFQVRKRSVSLLANADNVSMDGEAIPRGESRLIEGDAVIQVGNQRLEYRELRGIEIEGWPYVGEIRRPASSTYMLWGREYTIGRSRDSRVVLPDEPRNDNIVWKPKIGDGTTIKSKTGEIPKSRFYTDSIMVASEHGAIELDQDQPFLSCHARHCYVFIRRRGEVLGLFPTESGKQPQRLPLESNDEVLIGNCVFHVSFAQSGEEAVAPAPAPRVSSDSLVDAVSAPDFASDDAAPVDDGPSLDAAPDLGFDLGPDFGGDDPAPASFGLTDEPALSEPEGEPELAVEADAGPDLGYDEGLDLGSDPGPELGADAGADEGLDYLPPSPFRTGVNLPDLDDEEPELPPRVVPEAQASLSAAARSQPDELEVAPEALVEEVAEEALPAVPRAPVPVPPAAAAPAPVAPAAAASGLGDVVVVDDQDAQFELGRPARLVLVGWAVNGTVIAGNHDRADLVVPENRIDEDQAFEARDYFELRVRGRKSKLTVLDTVEVRVDGGPAQTEYAQLAEEVISVVRRDEDGEEDFTVDLRVVEDEALPDPRARLVSIDMDEPLAAALVTRGFPVRAPRELDLNGLVLTGTFDGSNLEISGYLDSYRTADGYRAFFVQSGRERFRTAPEDGAAIVLSPGDRLAIDSAVFRFDVP